jgi:hypothetical protein
MDAMATLLFEIVSKLQLRARATACARSRA